MDWNVLLTDLPTLIGVVIGVPAVLAAYIVGGEYLVRRLPDKARPAVRPWLWVAPALALVTGFLVLPAIGTIFQSFQDNHGNCSPSASCWPFCSTGCHTRISSSR